VPALLDDPKRHAQAGTYDYDLTLRLFSFPNTRRILLEFFAAGRDERPLRLGKIETAVEQ
jgi:hypothetical protein